MVLRPGAELLLMRVANYNHDIVSLSSADGENPPYFSILESFGPRTITEHFWANADQIAGRTSRKLASWIWRATRWLEVLGEASKLIGMEFADLAPAGIEHFYGCGAVYKIISIYRERFNTAQDCTLSGTSYCPASVISPNNITD
jgi:hypothetical protein